MDLHRCRLSDPMVAPLLAALAVEYERLYGPNHELTRATTDEFDPPAGGFVVVVDGGLTIAGGGFRPSAEGVCEVKRMWTHADFRRRGLAAMVLDALEDDARAAGYRRLRLETGPRQHAAIALYDGRGYRRIEHYDRYAEAVAFETDL